MMSRNRAAQLKRALVSAAGLLFTWLLVLPAFAQETMGTMPGGGAAAPHHGGEAALVVPKLDNPAIASFLGAIHWGLAMRGPASPRAQIFPFVWGVVPSLLAWLALLAQPARDWSRWPWCWPAASGSTARPIPTTGCSIGCRCGWR